MEVRFDLDNEWVIVTKDGLLTITNPGGVELVIPKEDCASIIQALNVAQSALRAY